MSLKVEVPRRAGRPARTATLELRWQEVELQPPAVALKKSWPPLKVYAVWAREVGAPQGAQSIEWLLLTTWPVQTLKMARRLVRWYALRWGIECWHKVLKVVCGVERRQMKSAQALERALALDMIVASRVLLLTRLGKEHPDLPAELFYTADELEVLGVKKRDGPIRLQRQANRATGQPPGGHARGILGQSQRWSPGCADFGRGVAGVAGVGVVQSAMRQAGPDGAKAARPDVAGRPAITDE